MSRVKTAKRKRDMASNAQAAKRRLPVLSSLIMLSWLGAGIAGYLSVTPNATDAASFQKEEPVGPVRPIDNPAIQLGQEFPSQSK